jgi:hypothetical protein
MADLHCGVIGKFVPSHAVEGYKNEVEPAQIPSHNTVVPPAVEILTRFKTVIPTTARVSFSNECVYRIFGSFTVSFIVQLHVYTYILLTEFSLYSNESKQKYT